MRMMTLCFCNFVKFDVDPAGRVKINLKDITSSNMLHTYYLMKVRIVLEVITM